jgi:hypothetical protein
VVADVTGLSVEKSGVVLIYQGLATVGPTDR